MDRVHEKFPSAPLNIRPHTDRRRPRCTEIAEPSVGLLLATALRNAVIDAKTEGHLARRDALLDELRALARAYPDDVAMREQLARGLLNTLNHTKAEGDLARRDALLDELRALARAYPDDVAMRSSWPTACSTR